MWNKTFIINFSLRVQRQLHQPEIPEIISGYISHIIMPNCSTLRLVGERDGQKGGLKNFLNWHELTLICARELNQPDIIKDIILSGAY